MLNVKNFGAKGDNSTDDYQAIVQAFATADVTGDSVHFPAGTYYTGQRIELIVTKDLVITGEGDLSRLGPRGAGGFLKINVATDYATVKIRDLRCSACHDNQTAFDITCAPATAIHNKKLLVMSDVTIDTGTHHTTKALRMAHAHNASIHNCIFTGPGRSPGSVAIEITALSVNTRISGSDLNNWEVGISCTSYQEGLFISNGAMVVVQYGIAYFSDQPLRSTLLQLSNFHIDARGEGSVAVWCNNVSAFQMTNCLLIAEGTVVNLERTYESQISGNQIYGPAPFGIMLKNGKKDLSCVAVTIIGNNFRGQETNIYADTLTRKIIAKHNTRNESDSAMKTLQLVTVDTSAAGSGNSLE